MVGIPRSPRPKVANLHESDVVGDGWVELDDDDARAVGRGLERGPQPVVGTVHVDGQHLEVVRRPVRGQQGNQRHHRWRRCGRSSSGRGGVSFEADESAGRGHVGPPERRVGGHPRSGSLRVALDEHARPAVRVDQVPRVGEVLPVPGPDFHHRALAAPGGRRPVRREEVLEDSVLAALARHIPRVPPQRLVKRAGRRGDVPLKAPQAALHAGLLLLSLTACGGRRGRGLASS